MKPDKIKEFEKCEFELKVSVLVFVRILGIAIGFVLAYIFSR